MLCRTCEAMRFVSKEELGLAIHRDIDREIRAEIAIYGICLHHESAESLSDSSASGCHLCRLLETSLADTANSTPSVLSNLLNFDPKAIYASRQEGQYGSFNEGHFHLDWHYDNRQYKMRMGTLRGLFNAHPQDYGG